MRRLLGLALLAPLLAGCGWFGGWAPYSSSTHSTGPVRVVPAPAPDVARWKRVEHLPAAALPGAGLFATAGCTACHTYAGSGSRNLNAPDLTAIGTRHLGIHFQIAHLECPSCVNPGSPMPPFKSLGKARLLRLAVFLEASKGTH
jgi:cbb3-type cytochrome oxidase cytochrome c subunit